MNWRSVALIFLLSPCASIFGQESQLVVAKLEAAVYPPMAVAARVWGDVTLHVALASDGTATVVSVESGPPMLRQAAINSATQSLFQSSQENRTGDYRLGLSVCLGPDDEMRARCFISTNEARIECGHDYGAECSDMRSRCCDRKGSFSQREVPLPLEMWLQNSVAVEWWTTRQWTTRQ